MGQWGNARWFLLIYFTFYHFVNMLVIFFCILNGCLMILCFSGMNFSDGLIQNVQVLLTKWKKTLTSYLTDMDEQVHLSILSPCWSYSCSLVLCFFFLIRRFTDCIFFFFIWSLLENLLHIFFIVISSSSKVHLCGLRKIPSFTKLNMQCLFFCSMLGRVLSDCCLVLILD